MKHQLATLAIMLAAVAPAGVASATLVDDFSGGVTAVNHPNPGAFGVWYDITTDAFASVAANSGGMQIDDGGFTNGIYAIYEAVVPADGLYTLSADMTIFEDAANSNGIRAYQLGVAVNGSHRLPGTYPSDIQDLATLSIVGNYAGTLDSGDNSSNPTETVVTPVFSASAGDNLLIAFSTDLDTGGFDGNSGTWGSSYVLVDNLTLTAVPETTPALAFCVAGLGMIVAGRMRRPRNRD
ncbi:MAG: hypothetical protein CMJ58_06910 [Planctomycetaceae bacterium]|nr:hypothetical protein [Planctomycetaceae bacterium]